MTTNPDKPGDTLREHREYVYRICKDILSEFDTNMSLPESAKVLDGVPYLVRIVPKITDGAIVPIRGSLELDNGQRVDTWTGWASRYTPATGRPKWMPVHYGTVEYKGAGAHRAVFWDCEIEILDAAAEASVVREQLRNAVNRFSSRVAGPYSDKAERLDTAQRQAREAVAAAEQLRAELVAARRERGAALDAQAIGYRQEIDKLKKKIGKLRKKVMVDPFDTAAELEIKLREVKASRDDVQRTLRVERDRNVALGKELTDVRSRLEAARRHGQRMETMRSDTVTRNVKLLKELSDAKADGQALLRQLDVRKAELLRANEAVKKATAAVDEAKAATLCPPITCKRWMGVDPAPAPAPVLSSYTLDQLNALKGRMADRDSGSFKREVARIAAAKKVLASHGVMLAATVASAVLTAVDAVDEPGE